MLRVKKPTESTVQYIVSTQCQATSIAGQALRVLTFVARAVAVLLALIILLWQYHGLLAVPASVLGRNLQQKLTLLHIFESHELNHALVLATAISLLWLAFRRGYREESLLVIRGLGIQTSTSSSSYLLSNSTRFIPTTAVQDIFIHEAFIGFQVRFYLSIVVENEDKVVVVFPVRDIL